METTAGLVLPATESVPVNGNDAMLAMGLCGSCRMALFTNC